MTAAYTPQLGAGGKLEISPDDVQYTEIGHVIDFGTSIDVAEVDVTHQQSQAAAPWYGEMLPGKVLAELTFNCNWDPGANEHEDVVLDKIGVVYYYQYTFKDGSVWSFQGFYRTIGVTSPNESQVSGDVSVRVTGAPTFAGSGGT